jgi:DNA-binding IscR family transcriptional regulator
MRLNPSDIAEVLEKAAAYIDAVESSKTANVRAEKTKAAKTLVDKIAETTGETFDNTVIEKLADTAPEISKILEKLTGSGFVDSLGGPDDGSSKTAADGGQTADSRFLNFLVS